ncbi:hypothetical protein BST97_02920 [Nonlabens spongiae]|uniref:Uncharacterized protein n=1 Tax=Nonlabens spongiae TaxID=331648 RepID=A0A1W6MHP7_9FLAO|nr:hypothetical protein [Nonlabens spongiae]ARN77036.1 hypothetical protein BST97_02920 [Nonlabens spongiae]
MNEKEIASLINQLRNQKNYDEAYVGYFQHEIGSHDCYIKANRQGLELHAAELLEAALKINEITANSKTPILYLDEGIVDKESDITLFDLELKKGTRNEIISEPVYIETWTDRLTKYLIIGIIILLLLLIIVGIITVVSWF